MSTEIGRLINVGVALEGSRGTAEDSAKYWMPRVDFDFSPRADTVVDESGVGVIDTRTDAKVVGKLAEGPIGGIVYDSSFGMILAATMGTWSTDLDTPISGVNTHTFTRLNTNQHPSLTIFHDDANVDEKYALAMLNQLTINAVLKDYIRFNAGFISKVGADTSSTPSYTAENSFLSQHATVAFADTVALLGTAAASAVRVVNLTINKNVEELPGLSTDEPVDIVNKGFSVTGDLEALFDDETYKDYVLNGDKKACLISIENTDVTIGTSSSPKLEITLAPMSFRDWGRSTGLDDVVTQTVAFDGNFGLTDSKTTSIVLINTQTEYA